MDINHSSSLEQLKSVVTRIIGRPKLDEELGESLLDRLRSTGWPEEAKAEVINAFSRKLIELNQTSFPVPASSGDSSEGSSGPDD